jgi:hypothetical protein
MRKEDKQMQAGGRNLLELCCFCRLNKLLLWNLFLARKTFKLKTFANQTFGLLAPKYHILFSPEK